MLSTGGFARATDDGVGWSWEAPPRLWAVLPAGPLRSNAPGAEAQRWLGRLLHLDGVVFGNSRARQPWPGSFLRKSALLIWSEDFSPWENTAYLSVGLGGATTGWQIYKQKIKFVLGAETVSLY